MEITTKYSVLYIDYIWQFFLFPKDVFLNQLKKRGLKRLPVEKKCVPLQADYYQISDKCLIYSALLCLFVSDEAWGVAEMFFSS